MSSILNYIIYVINKIVEVLNMKLFEDMPITYLELILGCIVCTFVFKLIFGGFKETEGSAFLTSFNSNLANKSLKYSMNHFSRKKQIVKNGSKKEN